MSKRLITPLHSISRATPIDSECYRLPMASALINKAGNAPTRFDQQAQVFQGYIMHKQRTCNTKVYDDGGLKVVKSASEPASGRPKPCASLKNVPGILPAQCFLLALLAGRKQIVVRDQLSLQKILGFVPVILAYKESTLPWLVDDRVALRPRRICGYIPHGVSQHIVMFSIPAFGDR